MTFLQFLAILPKLINALIQLHEYLKDKEVERWLEELDGTIVSLKEAKNVEDKKLIAVRLAKLIRRM